MSESNEDLNKFGKRILSPLRQVDPLDPKIAAEERAKFLLQGENLRKDLSSKHTDVTSTKVVSKPNTLRGKQPLPLFKALIAVILVAIILVGSSITVYAAQSSLPGEPLYTIKSISEDVRLSMALSAKAKLDLTLTYTNRRVSEISSLISEGQALPDQTSDRYQQELEHALELAAQMEDQQMQVSLGEIKKVAENQGMTMAKLLASLPEQASPAIIRLRERLQEQVMLSSFGETDPQAFRNEIRQRQQNRQGSKHTSEPEQTGSTPVISPNAPMPEQEQNGNGKDRNQPTEMPGHDGQGNGPENGQGQSTTGSGKHGPDATHTPKP
ncbi:MAG: DUF5667 domain-containing protein [Anaerolineales bacterium]